MIRFECPHCNKKLKAEATQGGDETDCPACGKTITVPAPPKSDDDTQFLSSEQVKKPQ